MLQIVFYSLIFFSSAFLAAAQKTITPVQPWCLLSDLEDPRIKIVREISEKERQTFLAQLPDALQKKCMYLYLLQQQHKNLVEIFKHSKVLFEIEGHSRILCLGWSPDSRYIAYATPGSERFFGSDANQYNHIRVFDTTTREQESIIEFKTEVPVHALTWSEDGKRITASCGSQKLTFPYYALGLNDDSFTHFMVCSLQAGVATLSHHIRCTNVGFYMHGTYVDHKQKIEKIKALAGNAKECVLEQEDNTLNLLKPSTITFSPDKTQCAAITLTNQFDNNIVVITDPTILKITIKQLQMLEKLFVQKDVHAVTPDELAKFPRSWQKNIIQQQNVLRSSTLNNVFWQRPFLLSHKEINKSAHVPFCTKNSQMLI